MKGSDLLPFILLPLSLGYRGLLFCFPDAAFSSCVAGMGERVLRLLGPVLFCFVRCDSVGRLCDGFFPVFVFMGRIVSTAPRRASRRFRPHRAGAPASFGSDSPPTVSARASTAGTAARLSRRLHAYSATATIAPIRLSNMSRCVSNS